MGWVDPADPTDWAVASALHRELGRRGHSVTVVGPLRRKGELPKEIKDGVPVRRFRRAGEILRFASEEAVDLWHHHVFARGAGPFLDATRADGRPLVASLHLVLPDYLPHAGGRAGLGAVLERASAVTTVSRSAREALKAIFPAQALRSSVVPNGSGPRRLGRAPRIPRPFLLCAARLAPYKGADLLVLAFARALESAPELRLVLCGRDQTRGGLARFVRRLGLADRVILLGPRMPGEVAALRRRCLAFVLPSRRENFPLALLEAMADGLPCVAGAAGGITEMIRHGKEGLLFPPGDVPALARSLVRVAQDARLRRRLGAAAKARSRRWSWERAASDYERIYLSVR